MFSEKNFSRLIQHTLLAGIALSCTLLFTGFAMSLAGAPSGALMLRGGLLALILTPAARVVMLIYGYLRSGELHFALLSALVLSLLAVAMLM